MCRTPIACVAVLSLNVLLAALSAECGVIEDGSVTAPDAAIPNHPRVEAHSRVRYKPETNQIVRNRLHRGKGTHEVWNVVNVAGHRKPAADPSAEPRERRRPSVVRATGQNDARGTSRRRLLDGANSDLAPVLLGGCSVTNYNVELTVGKQEVVVIFDTGSGDLALASTLCDSTCNDIPNLWKTAQADGTGQQGSLLYGSGSVQGDVFLEPVTLPGEPAVKLYMLAISSQARCSSCARATLSVAEGSRAVAACRSASSSRPRRYMMSS